MICKQCKTKDNLPGREFCSTGCRNLWVSNLMVKKTVKNKRLFGNSYYIKKDKSNENKTG